ncbi:hypothetical protein ACPCSC_05815 [Streptomyces lavendulocolor]
MFTLPARLAKVVLLLWAGGFGTGRVTTGDRSSDGTPVAVQG